MKKNFVFLSLASLLTGSVAFAQTVTTAPVGFINITVAGGSVAAPGLTLLSPTLTQPISFQGVINTITSSTITATGASWSTGQFDPDPNNSKAQYYVEVIHGTNAGVLANITAGTTAASVNIDTNLTSFVSAGDTVIIRQHVSLNSLLGASNTYGLTAGSSPSSADEVFIYDGQNSTPYFYFTGDQVGDAPGWYDSAFSINAGDVPIPPHCGVIIKRKSAGSVTITSTGTVKTGNTLFPVYGSEANLLGTLSAQGLTLDTSGLYTGSNTSGVTAGASPSAADEVYINGTPYFYFTGDQVGDGPGWYDSAFTTTAGSIAIAPGTAITLKRKSGVSFNWPIPAPSSF